MRQARFVLVALVVLGVFFNGYSDSYNQVSSSNLTSEQSILPQESSTAIADEKEDTSADNILKEYGPLTICADKATYDSSKETLTYYGNVFVMQIHNKHILCKEPKISKTNMVYFTRDETIPFKKLQQEWFEQAKELCADEHECNFISGQKLVMKLDKDRKVQTLTMESQDDELSQFYTFPTNSVQGYQKSKKIINGPLDGVGRRIIYNVVKKNLELFENAVVNQNENHYKGREINYDMDHDLVAIPGSKDRRSKIILDGVDSDTKIDTGLKPISEYNKKKKVNSGSTVKTSSFDDADNFLS
ncbi:hypothetical protein IB642_01980 [Allofrancisella guangzhouensis]|uniref:Organic solvent tolerance-like N-terminal domain-containing protein n=1 Tax=Allofrancisella guangzhouensis TaxID=594679 RepID=A0A0A8E5N6_9GAMM|nr:LptA/OstA family protein [Allofrancisella guangzhouensis]AJC48912.1 hypothetical protein SD28_04330 [Allofrancisella guangzhouensis]MBK2027125.1 hypothetical protein [Allofrancisella guangzhouensis]MBK2043786.1 hypothetical protein [Allofrancisella guangzhouensis]MBK2045637.1 hypothetical protein [Allofrancisella guangzhouensis]